MNGGILRRRFDGASEPSVAYWTAPHPRSPDLWHNSLGYQAPAGAWGRLYGVTVSQASSFSYLDTF